MKLSSFSLCAVALGGIALAQINPARACDWVSPVHESAARDTRSSRLRPAVYHPDAGDARLVQADFDVGGPPAIVGMWRFELLAPNNTLVDDGYAQWHADGTELQNSGIHAPMTSNFCMGVWREIAPRTYQLNHFPLAWEPTGQASAAAIRLTETVKLIDSDHMTGTFTLKVYPWDSTKGLTVSGPAVQTVTGTVTAERVTVTTGVPGEP